MGNRTNDLPPLSGPAHLIRELRYHEFSRQALGLLLMLIFAVFADPEPTSFWIGATIALLGMLVRLYASGFIVKNQQLATDGPYSIVRHPLYTGNLLLLIGFVFASGQWWALVVAGLFWWFYYPTAIEYEDRKLHRIFGETWANWSPTVPAVIPRGLGVRSGWNWSFATSLKQNLEPLVVVYTLFWLYYIARQLG
jgi:protein-S-isoprenylcysteine O-methyltransferase Ste14